jgi:hypothetical protein
MRLCRDFVQLRSQTFKLGVPELQCVLPLLPVGVEIIRPVDLLLRMIQQSFRDFVPNPQARNLGTAGSAEVVGRGPGGRDGLDCPRLRSAGRSVPLRVGAAIGAPGAPGGSDRLDCRRLGSAGQSMPIRIDAVVGAPRAPGERDRFDGQRSRSAGRAVPRRVGAAIGAPRAPGGRDGLDCRRL